MATEKPIPSITDLAEVALAERWFAETFGPAFTPEQILKLILYKLHKVEKQNDRMNSIL